MKNIRRLLYVLFALCLIAGFAFAAVSCGDKGDTKPCETHKDENKDGKCDVCSAEVELNVPKCDECVDETGLDGEPDGACDVCGECIKHFDKDGNNICYFCGKVINPPVDAVFSVKGENDAALSELLPDSEITVVIRKGATEVFKNKLDASGSVKVSLVPGEYSIEVSGFPDGWYCDGMSKSITVSAEKASFDFTAVDNNPDGSEKKPYFVATNKVTVDFEPGETLNYNTKGSKKYLIISNANAYVTYNGIKFTPNENGLIRVPIEPMLNDAGQLDTNSYTPFTITNTSDSVNNILAEFEIQPGSSEDPFKAELDTAYSTVITSENTVFYKWKSILKGYLVLDCNSDGGYVMMHNVTSCEVTGFTDGKGKLYLRVSKGDEIMIAVSTNSEEETDVGFMLKAYGGVEQMPLEISENAAFRLGRNASDTSKNSVCVKYTGETKKMTVISESISITVNGNVIEGTKNNEGMLVFSIDVSDGDIINITCEAQVTEQNNSVGINITF